MSDPRELPHLDYAPPPPRLNRKRLYRLLIAITLFFVVILSIKPLTTMWQNVRLQHQVHHCIAHPIAEGILAYSSDKPAEAIDSPDEMALETIEAEIAGGTGYSTNYVGQLRRTTLFMGELRKGRTRSFVNIEAKVGTADDGRMTIELDTYFVSPSSDIGGSFGTYNMICDQKVRPSALVYTAVRDPNDPAHISFQYCSFSETHRVDGYLNSNGGFNLSDKVVGR